MRTRKDICVLAGILLVLILTVPCSSRLNVTEEINASLGMRYEFQCHSNINLPPLWRTSPEISPSLQRNGTGWTATVTVDISSCSVTMYSLSCYLKGELLGEIHMNVLGCGDTEEGATNQTLAITGDIQIFSTTDGTPTSTTTDKGVVSAFLSHKVVAGCVVVYILTLREPLLELLSTMTQLLFVILLAKIWKMLVRKSHGAVQCSTGDHGVVQCSSDSSNPTRGIVGPRGLTPRYGGVPALNTHANGDGYYRRGFSYQGIRSSCFDSLSDRRLYLQSTVRDQTDDEITGRGQSANTLLPHFSLAEQPVNQELTNQ